MIASSAPVDAATSSVAAGSATASSRPFPVPSQSVHLSTPEAQRLGRRLQSTAVRQARVDHEFCDLVDQFDAGEGYARFDGVKSTAHYLGWACGVADGAAREHVRVARALRQMPHAKELFAQGRLSYSKVRELTRVVGVVDEFKLCELALLMTASQVARTVSSYRLGAGTRIKALATRRYSSVPVGDGMVRVTVVLPAEEAALLDAAVESARRAGERDARSSDGSEAHPRGDRGQAAGSATSAGPAGEGASAERGQTAQSGQALGSAGGGEPGESGIAQRLPGTGPVRMMKPADRVQALLDVASTYLDHVAGEPHDDHTLVVVHVDAASLELRALSAEHRGVTASRNVPAGTSSAASHSVPAGTSRPASQNVPAGTSNPHPTSSNTGLRPLEGAVGKSVLQPVADRQAAQMPGEQTFRVDGPQHLAERSRGNVFDGSEPFHPSATTGLAARGVCMVEGHGPIEPATAQRLTCNALVQGAIRDTDGNVLALGRTRRLASRAQRRALRIRDHGVCQFPGCASTRHLDAHHVVAWSKGGPTDLANLILLCRRHHTFVHEGGVRIQKASRPVASRWEFWLPDGRQIRPDIYPLHADPDFMGNLLSAQATKADRERATLNTNGEVTGTANDPATNDPATVAANDPASSVAHAPANPSPAGKATPNGPASAGAAGAEDDPDPTLIFPIGGGAGFSLHECVAAVFGMTLSAGERAA